ncbi:NAC domain-containing protein 78 [Hordeum vulgare]|nr:NAC domain-containing protein 78 [Hordeum vulgare]
MKHESLALRTNIEHRGIPIVDTKYLFCGRVDEDGAHLFTKCKLVKQGWRELALEKERMDLEDIMNKLRQGELPLAAADVVRKARCSILEYQEIFITPPKKVSP